MPRKITALQEFPPAVIEKLGYYVYLLVHPKTNRVFYVRYVTWGARNPIKYVHC